MFARALSSMTVMLFLLGTITDAEAARRSLRIEFEDFGWSPILALGSVDCPGSTPGSPSVFWQAIEFSGGGELGSYNDSEYCQTSIPYDPGDPDNPYLNETQFFDSNDDGIAEKIGSNDDPEPSANVTARVYSFLDRDPFDEGVQGFQWAFFFFPGDQTLVRLNGTLPIPSSDFYPYIDDDGAIIWNGKINGYDGEFWCFDGTDFAGTWDGEPAGTAPLAGCEFNSDCNEFHAVGEGGGQDPTVSPSNSPGCQEGFFTPGEIITLTARPSPEYKVAGWLGTDDDGSYALVNQVTKDASPEPQFADVFYDPVLYCPEDAQSVFWLDDDMESGAGGWTHSADAGADTWSLESGKAVSPTHAWHGSASESISDTSLYSPTVEILPTATNVALGFYSQRFFGPDEFECQDGAVIEYSVDGGGTWLTFQPSDFLVDPPGGLISATNNPLDSRTGWCGEQPWIRTEVGLNGLEGETLMFRFRIGTDDSQGSDGWYVDDVQVGGCVMPIHRSGFETR